MTDMTSDTTSADAAGPDEPPLDGLRRMVLPRSVSEYSGSSGAGDQDERTPPAAAIEYEIPGRPEPPPIPNGWYAVAGTDDLSPGSVMSTVAVARDLVVYRDEDGTAHVVDAHCPHLGAHLGGGRVVGNSLKCPYHGWEFGTDGACVEIPYSDARIPGKACLRTYPVAEQDGFIFFWYHVGGREPGYEVPRAMEAESPDWSDAHVWEFELVAALQEMAENNVDYAHLRYVHRRPFVPDDTSEFSTDGFFSTVVEQLPAGGEFYRHTWGPGVAILRVPDMMTVFAATTPIDRRHCRLRWHFHFKGEVEELADELIRGVTGDFGLQADVPIWRDKIFLESPLLVKADGNIAEFRRWYSQFYDND